MLGARLVRSFAGRLARRRRPVRRAVPAVPAAGGRARAAGRSGRPGSTPPAPAPAASPTGSPSSTRTKRCRCVHPALDPELNGDVPGAPDADRSGDAAAPAEPDGSGNAPSAGQYREPFEYGEILARQRAAPHRPRGRGALLPRAGPRPPDPVPEPSEPGGHRSAARGRRAVVDVGDPLADIDWVETVIRSPVVIPGITTVRREWGTSTGAEPKRVPVDLDLYVDSSGSMPNPQVHRQLPDPRRRHRGAVRAAGGRSVQATLWSGAGQFRHDRRVRARRGGRAAGAHRLLRRGDRVPDPRRARHLRHPQAGRRSRARPGGLRRRRDHDVRPRRAGARRARRHQPRPRSGRRRRARWCSTCGAGSTSDPAFAQAHDDGWDIHVVRDWADLVTFARAFSRRAYTRDGDQVIGGRR